MTGRVVALFVHPREHWIELAPSDEIRVTRKGIEGDVHSGRGKRAVLLMDANDLEELGLRPGELREQVTVDLPGLMAMDPGTCIALGEVVLELTGPCEPCTHIGEHVGVDDRKAFQETLKGRRGMLARVASVEGDGLVRVGDSVRVLASA